MIPRLLGLGSQSGPFGAFPALRIGVVLLFRTSLYAMASVSGKMVSHMREMLIYRDWILGFGSHSAPFGTFPVITNNVRVTIHDYE